MHRQNCVIIRLTMTYNTLQHITPVNQSNFLPMFVCLFVFSLLSHFWLIHLFYLHLLYQPYVGLCQATCVQSHQTQPTSAVAIATCEVQVSAADSHTVPIVATGVSKPLSCRLTLTFYTDQWEPMVIYHSISIYIIYIYINKFQISW